MLCGMGKKDCCDPSASVNGPGKVKVPNVMSLLPPLETCGRNQHVTFRCQTQSNLTPCDSLNAKTPSPSETCICLDRCYCTHANVSGRNHCVCLAYFFVLFRAAPFQPCSSQQMHTFTHTSATEPLLITRVSWDLYRETLAHIGCQCGVSLSESHVCVIFICTVKAAFIIYLVFLSVQNGAQLFPPQLIWNSNKHNISLRSMKCCNFVKIIKRL